MVNDVFYSPELLPQISKQDNSYQLSGLMSSLKFDDLMYSIFTSTLIPFWSLGYLYRFSIKSTSWFFFPLAYLANLNALEDKEQKIKAVKTQTWKKLFWFNLMVTAVLFLYFKFIGQYLGLLSLSDVQLTFIKENMVQLRTYFVPEAMWLLVVAVWLYFLINIFVSRKEHLGEKEYSLFTYWLIKLIFVLWMVFLAWHLVVLTNQHVVPFVVALV